MEKYRNRQEAGIVLAKHLTAYANRKDVLVLGLPRGGVPVAFEIARSLHVPLDVFIVRKLGVPGHVELAMGAIAMGGAKVFNESVMNDFHISETALQQEIEEEERELERRAMTYRGSNEFPDIHGKTIILVDDGIATGATIRAAIKSLRLLEPKNIIVAVPVADNDICEDLYSKVDSLICPLRPKHFYAVGAWYDDFAQTEDQEVHDIIDAAKSLAVSRVV